jgi:hypothetical protein
MRTRSHSRAVTFEDFQRLPVIPLYRPRFLTADQYTEAINLYHLARVALSGQECTKYKRMLWASAEIAKKYPSVSSTGAYKDISSGLEGY